MKFDTSEFSVLFPPNRKLAAVGWFAIASGMWIFVSSLIYGTIADHFPWAWLMAILFAVGGMLLNTLEPEGKAMKALLETGVTMALVLANVCFIFWLAFLIGFPGLGIFFVMTGVVTLRFAEIPPSPAGDADTSSARTAWSGNFIVTSETTVEERAKMIDNIFADKGLVRAMQGFATGLPHPDEKDAPLSPEVVAKRRSEAVQAFFGHEGKE